MVDSALFPWDVPLPAGQTVGWVIQLEADEPLNLWLRPGSEHVWEDARSAGKVPGQPVLFVQTGQGPVAWVGWGRVLQGDERWRVYGVPTTCGGRLDPPLPVLDPSVEFGPGSSTADLWDNRALGATLGLLRYRERTPYREVGARDLRLTDGDLHRLAEAQPKLRQVGASTPAGFHPSETGPGLVAELMPPGERSPPRSLDLGEAEKLVIDDLKRVFGDEIEFSSLTAIPDRFRDTDYWVVEGSFWSDFVLKNFQYAVVADTGKLAAKRVDQ